MSQDPIVRRPCTTAYDWVVTTKVRAVEATYAPGRVVIWTELPVGSCRFAQDLGHEVYWTSRGQSSEARDANGQAILSTLLTAVTSQKPVRLFGRNGDCEIEFIYLLR